MRELISESPRHGDRGLNNVSVRGLGGPVLAISREPGSRSPSIARALARLRPPSRQPSATRSASSALAQKHHRAEHRAMPCPA